MHYNVIVVMIVIPVILTLCYSIMSHDTLIIYYHASMMTLQMLFNITCTLVATYMILGRVECIHNQEPIGDL